MLLLLLLTAHLMGDFICQSSKLAEEKQDEFSKLLFHSIMYAGIIGFALGTSVTISGAIIPFAIIITTHFIIDWIRISIEKRVDDNYKLHLFFVDQVLHILMIVLVYFLFNLSTQIGSILLLLVKSFGFEIVNNVMVYLLIYIIILQPSAVVIKKVFFHISKEDINFDHNSQLSQTKNAGYLIGILERVIIVTLVLQGQISTIGLVLAAKSLARFRQLEDKDFAERYLVGTLISVAISIVATLFLKSKLI